MTNGKTRIPFLALLLLVLLAGVPAAMKGFTLSMTLVEGLWSYSWRCAAGTRMQGGYTFQFKDPHDPENPQDHQSSYLNTHTRLRGDRSFGIALLENAWRIPELQREPLQVHVHPLDPQRSVLVPGLPLLAAFQLLAILTILVPAIMALPILVAGLYGNRPDSSQAYPIIAATLFYFISTLAASLYMVVWGYLLRTMPVAWPLMAWAVVSAFLFFRPPVARWLYGFRLVRRAVYFVLIFGGMPLLAIFAGLSLPYVIVFAAAAMALTVLIKPFARAGNTPLYALLMTLVWVPLYLAGLLAPTRALVQLLHEVLPYMPYHIGIAGIENPRVMACLDVAVGISGIALSILFTCIDSNWRARQAAQVKLLPTSKARSVALGLVELQGRARHISPATRGPILHYNSRYPDAARKQPFFLEDETGRILIDPGEIRFRHRWMTSFGGRISETVLKNREQLPDLSTPHIMTLQPGDPVYLLGTAQIDPNAPDGALDSDRLVVRRRSSGLFSTPLWRISQGRIKPEHTAEDIFFLTDTREEEARKRIMKGIWQIWVWSLVWIATSLSMFHFQLPRTRSGYERWSMQEIIRYAAPQDRLEAVLDFIEREARRSKEEPRSIYRMVHVTPLIGPFIDRVNTNLRQAQIAEGSNFLWRQPFANASEKELRLAIASVRATSENVRWWAVSKLRETTAYPEKAVPALIDALTLDSALTVRSAAAASLGAYDEKAFVAIPALAAAARSSAYKLRRNAIATLTGFSGIPEGPAHDLFLEMVEDKEDWVRHAGVKGLKNMADHTQQDARKLLALTGDPHRYTRSMAIGAVKAIAPDSPEFPETLLRALNDDDRLLRHSAVRALAGLKTVPDEAAAPLGAMISDQSVSGSILPMLVQMGARAAPAVPYLAGALSHSDSKVAYNAAFALSRMGNAASPAVDQLSTALNHKDKFVRRYSAQALGACGPAAARAVPALVELQKDPDLHVSSAARRAVILINKSQFNSFTPLR
jgi:HEAT repeat protein